MMPDEQFWNTGWGELGAAPPLRHFTRFTPGPWLDPRPCDARCAECRRGWVRFGAVLACCGRCHGRGITLPVRHGSCAG
jgi:hypothetical protein